MCRDAEVTYVMGVMQRAACRRAETSCRAHQCRRVQSRGKYRAHQSEQCSHGRLTSIGGEHSPGWQTETRLAQERGVLVLVRCTYGGVAGGVTYFL
eukprot:2337137-Prymnesium_polylepis.1